MQINRFEKIGATPSYSNRDISQHLLAVDLPAEEKESIRQALLDAGTRMMEELTTFRDTDYDWKPTQAEQQAFEKIVACILPGKQRATAVPLQLISRWFLRLSQNQEFMAGVPELTKTTVKAALKSVKDPWDCQAIALLCMRTAMELEPSGHKDSAAIWDLSLQWWQKFFVSAKPEDCYTYQMQRDRSGQAACEAVWAGFLYTIAESIYRRCTGDYIRTGQLPGVSACLLTLSQPRIRAIAGQLSDKALNEAVLNIQTQMDKLYAANNLRGVIPLIESLPEVLSGHPAVQAKILETITREVQRRIKDDTADLALAKEQWQLSSAMVDDNCPVLLAVARNGLLTAVKELCLYTLIGRLEHDKTGKTGNDLLLVLDILPWDYVLQEQEGEKITTEAVYYVTLLKILQPDVRELAASSNEKTFRMRAKGVFERAVNVGENRRAASNAYPEARNTFLFRLMIDVGTALSAQNAYADISVILSCIPSLQLTDPSTGPITAKRIVARVIMNTIDPFEALEPLSSVTSVALAQIRTAFEKVKRIYLLESESQGYSSAITLKRNMVTHILNIIMGKDIALSQKLQLLQVLPQTEEINSENGTMTIGSITEMLVRSSQAYTASREPNPPVPSFSWGGCLVKLLEWLSIGALIYGIIAWIVKSCAKG